MNTNTLITVSALDAWAKKPDEAFELTSKHGVLQLDTCLRHLPTRRLTCRAMWQGKPVIAKLFYGPGFNAKLMKEALTLQALKKSSISAPEVLYSEKQADYGLLIIQYIEDAETLSSFFWRQPEPVEFEARLLAITELMLACQQAGFEIKDAHLDNFLYRQGEVYLIDAGDISKKNDPLSQPIAVKNLALLYAQLPVTLDQQAFQLLTRVLKNLPQWQNLNEGSWQQALIEQRRWRQKKFINKKVFRSCTDYISEHNTLRFLMAKRNIYSKDMALALADLDGLIDNGQLLKDGGTATVARVDIAGQAYVLKRYNIKKPIHSLIRGLKWSRAAVSWRNGLLLEMLGIPTAQSYVMIEQRCGPLRRRSYLLSEYIDAPQAWEIYDSDLYDDESKKHWARKIVNLFLLLKRSQISHGDLKAQNILCPEDGPLFIDLDGLNAEQSPANFWRQFKKDIARFQISWPDQWKVNPYFSDLTDKLLADD
ncbi:MULTISPECIES: lipopolysaccharide kinase InaA family protein [Cycloclasticus]|uniref:Serine/threonine protein kinase n=1 Tax=Cycloclasticus zancles 78-ME TaxID=1198232 RepID=S5TV93_9GAMM|nr:MULTISPECIES: lipopolysaccharide kinase InaA family protein [Cycloclasticus]AGS39020.1 Serine/threonine protein kinase [Cycloclasticus zancles 78-ME]MDF1830684.1 lipopolysaccharide kinase InaA family protein [Cycloclasticus pugetii]PHR51010.1 MAG: serine/threonine protein phosphatase [Cycloclasticus sp.]